MRRMYSKNQLKEIIDKNFTTPEEVKDILLDDKDVLKHLEYNEDDFIITFPRGVLPLRYYNYAQEKSGYFDYSSGKILDDSGVQIGQISWDDENVYAEYAADATPDRLNDQIEYMMFIGGSAELSPKINGYALYHTQPAGTKLYRHLISIGPVGPNQHKIIIINNTGAQITSFSSFYGMTVNEIGISVFIKNFMCFYKSPGSYECKIFKYDGTIETYTLDSTNIISDTVTEL